MPTLQLNRLSLGVASTAPPDRGWPGRPLVDGLGGPRPHSRWLLPRPRQRPLPPLFRRRGAHGIPGHARLPVWRGVGADRAGPGQFDDSALVQYREKLLDLQARGIRPQLTLHHFTNPMWFERMGAFTRLENVPLFLRFVEHTVRALGDLISEYITTNEPNVYATNGYFSVPGRPARPLFLARCT